MSVVSGPDIRRVVANTWCGTNDPSDSLRRISLSVTFFSSI